MYQSDKTVCSVLDNETSSDGDNTGFCVNKVSDVSSSDHAFIDFCFEPKKTRQTRVVRFIYNVNSFKQFWSLDFKTPLQAPKSRLFSYTGNQDKVRYTIQKNNQISPSRCLHSKVIQGSLETAR